MEATQSNYVLGWDLNKHSCGFCLLREEDNAVIEWGVVLNEDGSDIREFYKSRICAKLQRLNIAHGLSSSNVSVVIEEPLLGFRYGKMKTKTCVDQGILFGLVFAACEFTFGKKPVNGSQRSTRANNVQLECQSRCRWESQTTGDTIGWE